MVSEPRFPEMNSSSRKDIGANQDTLWKARCTKVSPYPDALNRLMPRHGLLGVVGQINPLEGHSDPIGDVREVASMEGRDRVESLGGLEVAAAQEKDQLIACRAQAGGNVLERRGKVEAAFTFDAIENRREV